ncbi:MAG: hypothetical protein ABIN37_00680 [Burkholderiaceae bacterium]
MKICAITAWAQWQPFVDGIDSLQALLMAGWGVVVQASDFGPPLFTFS